MTTSSSLGISYSVGTVKDFNGAESYAGEFYDINAAKDMGVDHCWAPDGSISADCITFSSGASAGIGWDYYYVFGAKK